MTKLKLDDLKKLSRAQLEARMEKVHINRGNVMTARE